MSALCLLDFIATFDTVDHELLLHRLERRFGLRGVVLAWFASYLAYRCLQVYFDGSMSSVHGLHCLLGAAGVSPWSVIIHALHCGPG